MTTRFYSNTAPPTQLTVSISGSTSILNVADITGLPLSTPFSLILDQGTASEEVVEVTSVNGLALTVTRGIDGTTGIPHASNATVVHGVSARDYQDSRNHENSSTGVHGIAGGLVGTTDAQTLSNKTLASPRFSGVVPGGISADGLTSTGAVAAPAGFWFGNTNDEVHIVPTSHTSLVFSNPGASIFATCTAAQWATPSTRKLKQDIQPAPAGLQDVLALAPVTYAYKAIPDKREAGLIAEDLAEVYPQAVTFDEEGAPAGIDYGKLTPLLIRAIQDLAQRVADLEG